MLEELPFNLFITSWIIVHSIMLNYIQKVLQYPKQVRKLFKDPEETSVFGGEARLPFRH